MKILKLFLVGIVALFFISCGDNKGGSENKTSNNDKNNQQISIKVAIDPTYPPFGYTENGSKVVGFDIDILEEVSKLAGFSYTTQVMNFDGIIPALHSGKVDMAIASMSATAERKKSVSFTDSYYEGVTQFLQRKGDNNDPKNLHGKKIGVYIGTVQDMYATKLSQQDPSIQVLRSSDSFGAMMNLKSKKVDVFFVDKATAKGYLKTNPDLAPFYEMPDGSDGLAIAFDLGKHQDLIAKINEALKEIRKNGTYEKLLKKYDLN